MRTRELLLNGMVINGRRMDSARIDEVVTVGDTEVWEVTNGSGTPHSFHVHDVQFQILDLDGRPPAEHLRGPKDTVCLPPGTTARLIMRFTDYTDPDWPYMFHCHLLQHEDRGMMGQFVVVEPGQRAGPGPSHHDHGQRAISSRDSGLTREPQRSNPGPRPRATSGRHT